MVVMTAELAAQRYHSLCEVYGMNKKNKGQIVRKIAKKKYLMAKAKAKKKRMEVGRLPSVFVIFIVPREVFEPRV